MACFRFDLEEKLDIIYEEDGDSIARRFYIPVLRQSVRYDRISGYFSVDSLVVVAAGLAGFIHNKGRMRLVVGAHDIGPDLQRAYFLSKEKAEELLQEIGKRVAEGLERIEDVLSRRRLEALAWMLVNGTLEIRVAIPKRTFLGLGNGIFHQKRLLFFDKDDCSIAAAGSANETRMAYEMNGENLTLHMSWAEGHQEYLSRYAEGFEALWEGRHPDYYVYTLPEAIEKRLKERFYPSRPPERDPLERPGLKPKSLDVDACVALAPAALLVRELGAVAGLTHLGLGPVRLYPHQAYAVDFVLSRFPHRMLLADEVGLGKTLEAGAIIKRLIDSGQVQRVLILSPKNVARQWLDELWHHFGLRFWLLETGPKRFVAADGSVEFVEDGNPFDRPGFDFVVTSWHYARGSRRREPELLRASRFFDLVVVDEAHGARLKRESGRIRPTRLHELCFELGITSPHMLLLSATPVQLYAVEAHDLLRILGLGGPWVHEEDFQRYYEVLMADTASLDREEWIFALRLASWVARSYLTGREIGQLIDSAFRDRDLASDLKEGVERGRYVERAVSEAVRRDPDGLKRLLMALSPVQWFMVRNTRERLMKAGPRPSLEDQRSRTLRHQPYTRMDRRRNT